MTVLTNWCKEYKTRLLLEKFIKHSTIALFYGLGQGKLTFGSYHSIGFQFMNMELISLKVL